MTQPALQTPRPALWKYGIGTLAGLFLGLVFLVAAWGKVIDPHLFAEQIEIEGLDFFLSAESVVFIAIGLEIALGTALILGLRRMWVLLPTAALTAFFLFLTGRHYWNDLRGIVDQSVSCGCFGNLVMRTPAEAFWQDLFLLVPALLLAFLGRSAAGLPGDNRAGSNAPLASDQRNNPGGSGSRMARIPSTRVAIVALVTLAGLLLAWRAPRLPLDDLATRLRPGTTVDDLCYGRDEGRLCLNLVIPELDSGSHLVVIADITDPEFGDAVDGLNSLALAAPGQALWVLTDATADEQYAFFWQWGPVFEIREAPHALLRPLYRRLPRSFIVQDGEVTETFNHLPTEVDK